MWKNIIPGNYSKLSLTACNKRILLKCIYAPNEDSRPEDEEHKSMRFLETVFNYDNEDGYEHEFSNVNFNVVLSMTKTRLDTCILITHTREG